MAPNNFEDNIKDKLEKRTIQPSADAWNRLENQLDHSKEKSKNKPLLWIGLAASIVGVLLMVSQFLKEPNVKPKTPVIVETPNTLEQSKTNQEVAKDIKDKEIINTSERENTELKTNPTTTKSVVEIEPKAQEISTPTTHVASVNDKSTDQKNFQPVELKQEALSIEDQKINEVIAQVKTLKDKNKTITDADVEALLQQAQKEIRTQKLYNENTGVVDAKLLLEDVEADLDKSFRDKVFEALKANFNFVKTAVAQRND